MIFRRLLKTVDNLKMETSAVLKERASAVRELRYVDQKI
jgi:hypothetical protein